MYRSRAVSADANSQHNSMTNGGQPSSQLAPQLGGRQVSKKSSWRDLRRKASSNLAFYSFVSTLGSRQRLNATLPLPSLRKHRQEPHLLPVISCTLPYLTSRLLPSLHPLGWSPLNLLTLKSTQTTRHPPTPSHPSTSSQAFRNRSARSLCSLFLLLLPHPLKLVDR
jgi:hypothetical protein